MAVRRSRCSMITQRGRLIADLEIIFCLSRISLSRISRDVFSRPFGTSHFLSFSPGLPSRAMFSPSQRD
jgi:hypothetical protein